ncbi:MAG: hypothetical protein ACUVWP_07605 [bacterium]
MKLIGKGIIMDITTGEPFGDYGELLIRFGIDTITIPRGDTYSSYTIPIGSQALGRISWYDISAEEVTSLIGGDSKKGSIRKVDHEAHTIPQENPVINLENDDVITNSEVVMCKSGDRYRRVKENP